LPEVGDESVAWVDDASDAGAWSEALRSLLADDGTRAVLAARGLARAATFSWDRCTAQTLAVLESTAAEA
jgi:glycosyltransferase involved in cell wall biosynthesis